MKAKFIIASAALGLAACGQPAAPEKEEAPPAPTGMLEQLQSRGPEDQLVFAYQQLIAYQQAHPEAQPPCTAIRGTESRGVIPADVAPDSIYAPFVGATVISVQCGVLISRAAMEPWEHWLVVFAPGAADVTVVNCARGNVDACPVQVPRAAAAGATPTAP
jgi:hypothetical protein